MRWTAAGTTHGAAAILAERLLALDAGPVPTEAAIVRDAPVTAPDAPGAAEPAGPVSPRGGGACGVAGDARRPAGGHRQPSGQAINLAPAGVGCETPRTRWGLASPEQSGDSAEGVSNAQQT